MSRRFCLLLCVALLQSSCGSPRNEGPPAEQKTGATQAEMQVSELQGKITKWQSNRDKLKTLLEQLQTDKAGILEKLVDLGVKSESDLANNPKGQVLHSELKDIVKQIALYDKKYQDYDLAILKSESRVRSVARQLAAREAGVSDTELEELTRSMVTLEESLSSEKEAAVPIDLKDTLKEELASYHAGQQAAPAPQQDNTQTSSSTPTEPLKQPGQLRADAVQADGQWLDVLSQVDVDRDRVKGNWRRVGTSIVSNDNVQCARIMFPVAIQGEYDLRVRFTHEHGACVETTIPVGKHCASIILKAKDGDYLEAIDGRDGHLGPCVRNPSSLKSGQECELLAKVRLQDGTAEITVLLDGAALLHWSGQEDSLNVLDHWKLPEPNRAGFGYRNSSVVLNSVQLRSVATGQAQMAKSQHPKRDLSHPTTPTTERQGSISCRSFPKKS